MRNLGVKILLIVLIVMLLIVVSSMTMILLERKESELLASNCRTEKLASSVTSGTVTEILASGFNTTNYYNNDVEIFIYVNGNSLIDPVYSVKDLQYSWSGSTETPSSYEYIAESASEASNSIMYKIKNIPNDDGIWYLHVKYTAPNNSYYVPLVYFGPIKFDCTDPIAGTVTMREWSPSGPVLSSGGSTTNPVYISLTNGSDALSGHKSTVYSVNGGDETGAITCITTVGKHEIVVKTTDNAGNIDTRKYTITIKPEDATVPTLSIERDHNTPTNASRIIYTFKFSENVTGFEKEDIKVTGGTKGTFNGSGNEYTLEVVYSESGNFSVIVDSGVCTDAAGNGNSYGHCEISIDLEKPSKPNIVNSGNGNWTNKTVTLKVTSSDEISKIKNIQYKIGTNGSWIDLYENGENTGIAEGQFLGEMDSTIYVRAIDKVGNISEEASTLVRIDKTKPTVIGVSGNPTNWTGDTVFLTVNGATDTRSGLASKPYKFGDGEWQTSNVSPGYTENKSVIVYVKDNAGNIYQETINITKICKNHTEVDIPGTEAKCETEGKTAGKKCSVCDKVTLAQTTIPATGHTEIDVPGIEAKCETEGKTAGKKCSVCDKVTLAQTTIPATGHTEVDVPGIEAKCEIEGKTSGKKCSVCDKVTLDQTTIPATGHTEVVVPAVAASCEMAGKTAGKKCSVCNKVLVEQQAVLATGHKYENGECTNCGEKSPEITIKVENCEVKGNMVTRIKPETKVKDLKIETNAEKVEIYNKKNEKVTEDEELATGLKLKLELNGKQMEYTIVVTGDLDGDSKIGNADLLRMARYKAGLDTTLNGAYLEAADVIKDNKPAGNTDLLKLVRVLVGLETL